MNPGVESQSTRRLQILARLMFVWALVILGRLLYFQVYSHEELRNLAQRQQEREMEIQAPRGAILDRSGHPLAMSLQVDSVAINPQRITDPSVAAGILAGVLGVDQEELYGKIRWSADNGRGFLWVKRKVTPEESERLRSYNFDWIDFRPDSRRFYPKGPLAAHIVGSVDHRERGNSGLELSMNEELEGRHGSMRMMTDVRRRGYDSQVFSPAQDGKNITLTIDERIQFVAERALAEAARTNHCKTGSLVAMNPHTGEILAMANYPGFDPNLPLASAEELSNRLNLAVSAPFEPGSVFKVITLAAALETTNLRPDNIIPCGNGSIRLFGRTIRDHKSHSSLSFAEVLHKSSNIGAINIGLRVGEERLLEYILRFGFGERAGIPLPAESPGLVRKLQAWGKSSIGSVAMGHEISTTSLQLAQACSVIANGGLLVRPRLIRQKQRPGEAPEIEQGEPVRRILKPETAIIMRQLMEGVVLKGTGKLARLDGYTAGGKTGSAQIFDFQTHRYTHKYNASFIGFAPVTNPAIVVVVTLNGASRFGGAVAAPVFREVATAALRFLDIPKDVLTDPKLTPDPPGFEDDDLAIAELAMPPIELEPALVPAVQDSAASEPVFIRVAGPRVPDFYGKTLREVLEEAAAKGLTVEYSGKGVARAQVPAPGSVISPDEKVRVQFAR